ncbi:MAG: type II toxin-antitoxin system Phd/YefM family antitoxin [Chloroflexota bacterium]|nr:type II toxin-antitoxin system Phd/YefM family antitoxin [Chloroflexota bacterium]
MNILPATAVREQFRQALEDSEREPVIITQHGRPKAVLVAFSVYEAMARALENREDRLALQATLSELKAAGSPKAAGYLDWDAVSREL